MPIANANIECKALLMSSLGLPDRCRQSQLIILVTVFVADARCQLSFPHK